MKIIDEYNIKSKVALVTGAGRSIGKSIATELGRQGASIIVNDINENEAIETTKQLNELGSKSFFIQADVFQKNQVEYMIDKSIKNSRK
jgi:7-alpha-hydroxysteroid dehydrogenase